MFGGILGIACPLSAEPPAARISTRPALLPGGRELLLAVLERALRRARDWARTER